jgi:hypothetical protein
MTWLCLQNKVPHVAIDIPCNDGTFDVQEKENGAMLFTERFVVSLSFRQDEIRDPIIFQKFLRTPIEKSARGIKTIGDHFDDFVHSNKMSIPIVTSLRIGKPLTA